MAFTRGVWWPGAWGPRDGCAVPVSDFESPNSPMDYGLHPEPRREGPWHWGKQLFAQVREGGETGSAEGGENWVGIGCPSYKLQFTWRKSSPRARSLPLTDLETTFFKIVI